MITSLKLAVVCLLSRPLNSSMLTYCLCRRRMPLRRQLQHNIDTRPSPPHRTHLFVLCHRCRMPACANRRRSARRLYSHLRTCRGEKGLEWEGESAGGGSETETRRIFEGDATKVQSAETGRRDVMCVCYFQLLLEGFY